MNTSTWVKRCTPENLPDDGSWRQSHSGSGGSGYTGGVEEKTCATCGRRIEWRKKWARDWENVRYCSDACRRHRPGDTDRALETTIVELLDRRAAGKTICPSEAAKQVGGDDWRDLMEPARRAARRLVDAGTIEITQQGHVVDPSTAKGPIRLRKV
ncbi:DUF2256 and DUF3253 domain-containing protein [Actinomycetospora soli]|uniref:DUF2256 and DUF3253 domain-containing protein n=1 Tax=Actinomycetospora soli TaxID=2893887 RepID=UPI001E4C38BE|nr:DUF2256 and DUF3253 domain-containing protein [Actinomycetospora soli]MCD2188673.1 DUF2256 and DUF3253 domain-containing protein [Actinomycetospora soli]